ncbi:MAG: O-antigen ligase family protein, partial [Patescibacteria group bacterium]
MEKILYLTLCLPMLAPFIFSGFLPEYAVIASVTIGLLGLLLTLHFRKTIGKNIPNELFMVFLVILAILIPFSLTSNRSIESILWWLSYFAVFIFAQCLVTNKRLLETLAKIFVTITTFYAIYMAYNFTLIGLTSYTRLGGLAAGHDVYGAFLILPLFLSIYFAIKEIVRWQKVLWSITSSILFSSVILTFSRGTWLSIIVGLVVLLVFFKGKYTWRELINPWKIYISIFIITVIFIGGIWFAAKQTTIKANPVQPASTEVFSNEDADNNAFISRLNYFNDALHIFIQSPVFGFGGGTYPYALRIYKQDPNYGSFADPHNWLLRMLVENGILATAIFLAFLIVLFINIWKSLRKTDRVLWLNVTIFIGLLTGLFHGLMDFDWSHSVLLL